MLADGSNLQQIGGSLRGRVETVEIDIVEFAPQSGLRGSSRTIDDIIGDEQIVVSLLDIWI